ncbi:MAG TPA: hypothetical protein VL992_15710 [Tepidisphaeraceae bacterium]|nr:hypothetical protein [Tepidisphaeraceae bacterium]
MIKRDPIVEEVHRLRRKFARRFGHDLEAMCESARQQDQKDNRKTVRLSRRREISTPGVG